MRPLSELQRQVAPFEVVSPYQPSGDQPTAIAELVETTKLFARMVAKIEPASPAKAAPRP